MSFHVGQKVVCVRAPVSAPYGPWRVHPKLNEIYTVRDFKEVDSIWLVELINDIGISGTEAGFCISRFRPIVEKKTDISIFTAMLNPKKARERA